MRTEITGFLCSVLAPVMLTACAGGASLSNTPVLGDPADHPTLGYFVSVPDLYNALSIDKHDGSLFVSLTDVPTPLRTCRDVQFAVCIYDDGSAFIVRKGPLSKGDRWSYEQFEFSVSEVFESLAYIDVRSKSFDGDTLRLYVQGDAVLGFSWGVLLAGDCTQCFEERINYLWIGANGRRFDNGLLTGTSR